MGRAPRFVLTVLVMAVCVVLALLQPSPSLATPPSKALTIGYIYDTLRHDKPTSYIAPERGPPDAPVQVSVSAGELAVGLGPHGASVRPEVTVAATYDTLGPLAYLDSNAATTGGGPRALDTALPSRAPSGVAANTGMAGVRTTGQVGEELAGIIKNTERIPAASGKVGYRIPDELNGSVIGEVKNVARLNYSSQLRDFGAYAQANKLQYNLYVRGNTRLSGPLQNAVDSGAINLIRNLP